MIHAAYTKASNAVSRPMYVATRSGAVEKPVMPSIAKFQSFQKLNLVVPAERGARW